MLKNNIVQSVQAGPSPVATEPEFGLPDVFDFLRRQIFPITATLAIAVALAVMYLLTAAPHYTARLHLMIDARKVQPFAQQAIVSAVEMDATVADSQLEVLKSEAVGLAVVNKLKLTDDPEFTGSASSLLATTAKAIGSLLGTLDETTEASSNELRRRALRHLKSNLAVQRVGRTYVLEISYRSLDRNKAAAVANAFGDAYIADQLNANFDATKRASDWLQERLTELREESVTADRAVQDYRAKNNLVDAGAGRTVTEQQLGDVNTQLVQARAQVAEAKARFDRIQAVDFTEQRDSAVADALNNPVIVKLREQYLDNSRQIADVSSRYGANHTAVTNLKNENEQLRLAGRDELRRIAEAYRSDYEIAKSRLESVEKSLAEMIGQANLAKQASVALRVLESQAQSYRTLYDSFLQRFADSTQQQSFPKTESRVITPASVGEKSHPKTTLVLGAAVMAGLCAGVGLGFGREKLDRVLKTSRQVEQQLGIDCLGILPAIESKELRESVSQSSVIERAAGGPPSLPSDLGLERQVIHSPFSRFTETIRAIKVTADMTGPAEESLVIGVVSALPGEGKSTVAANLANLLRHTGHSALLIDGDLRRPALSARMTPNADRGLVEVLSAKAKFDEVVWRDPVTNLDFLPTVFDAPIAHTAEIIASNGMATLLRYLRPHYRYIVIDLPPLAPVVDARAASELIDKFLLVIEWGATSPVVINDVLGSADVIAARMLGAVLNKADLKALNRIEPYKARGYYDYYATAND